MTEPIYHPWVIVAAGGSGVRFGASLPKQFVPLGGRPLVVHTLEALAAVPNLEGFVVVVPVAAQGEGWLPEGWVPGGGRPLKIVAGGATRTASVRAGLRALPSECDLVLVHDGARPCVSAGLVQAMISGAIQSGAAVPGLVPSETIKRVDGQGRVLATLERQELRSIQTPQAFRRALLEEAYASPRAEESFPDDAALVEALGHLVTVLPGEPENGKVTRPEDLVRMGLLFPRIGFGYDVHRLVEGRPLILGGMNVPFERGLLGHSDADVLLHAVIDALLGAAGLPDIGEQFPDSDPQYRGSSSLTLLAQVGQKIRAVGYQVGSIDSTIVAQQPKLAAFLPDMARKTAQALGIDCGALSIKAKTEEGLGFTGTGQGISAYAVAWLFPRRGTE